jgi:hypothetical protein
MFMGDDVTIMVVNRSDYNTDDSNGGTKSPMDILASIFFAVAATWLLFALMYASMVLMFLRLRARGDLNRIYEADFGRIHVCGTRLYVSLGWILRRYVRHIHPHPHYRDGGQPHLMTRKERRDAMEVLLTESVNNQSSPATDHEYISISVPIDAVSSHIDEEMQHDENTSIATEGPVCSICLGGYENDDELLGAKTCSHQFHKDCILDWLQRQNHAECPCCRVPMVEEEDVWNVVRSMRDQMTSQKPKTKQRTQLTKSSTTSSSSFSSPSVSFDNPSQDEMLPPAALNEYGLVRECVRDDLATDVEASALQNVSSIESRDQAVEQ